jgi:hypothetical protein
MNVVQRLANQLGDGAFVIADHWEADQCAIGLASPHDDGVLVYIQTYDLPEGMYDIELELPLEAGDEMPYKGVGEMSQVTYSELLEIVKKHLQ